jgi:hypothetical protein
MELWSVLLPSRNYRETDRQRRSKWGRPIRRVLLHRNILFKRLKPLEGPGERDLPPWASVISGLQLSDVFYEYTQFLAHS